MVEAEQKAAGIISDHRPQIEQLVRDLERHETLDRAQIEACLGPPRERPESAQKARIVAG